MIRALSNPTRHRQINMVAICATALALAIAGAAIALPKILLWNATPSVPKGLYWIARGRRPMPGELAILWLPNEAATLANQRHYLPLNVPLIKPVAAGPGQQICRNGREISVDGHIVARALDRDHVGRTLPVWTGCFRLTQRRLFVLNAAVPTSFDGRYFGSVEASRLIGRAIPIVTQEPVTRAYAWRLFPHTP